MVLPPSVFKILSATGLLQINLEGLQFCSCLSVLSIYLHCLLYQHLFALSSVLLDFRGGSDSKTSVCNAGDPGLIPESGRSPGEGNCNPLQYPCLKNPMDRGAWYATVHGVVKSWIRLSSHFFFTFCISGAGKLNAISSKYLSY